MLEFVFSKEWRRDPVAKRTTGIVRWFDGSKGYGYIDAKDGEQVFVHYSALSNYDAPLLMEGEQVEFFLNQTTNGPQATDVSRHN
jgi:CspA family cold shock protein